MKILDAGLPLAFNDSEELILEMTFSKCVAIELEPAPLSLRDRLKTWFLRLLQFLGLA